MNLVALAALIAVASAAKLDRTYLPPASAKTAGGSPGSLQTPFSGNSFNNGLGGLPKGSYNNNFDGVVVDAALAGTRTADEGVSGLGASRISYGSSDSKVGAAAFKVNQAGFRQPSDESQASFDGQTAGSQVSQGFQRPSFSNSERPRAALDRSATILRFENEVGSESYNYAFETDNGIVAEENGVTTNGVQAQGGFSYTGDDGQVYSVSYTADEGGYQPKGDHLPTPPPIPEEILKSLEKNARDEAAGLIDDGSYDAQKYNAGSDYAESDSSNGNINHQSSGFGHGAEADAMASGTFINQNNQPFARPNAGQNGFASQGPSNGASGTFGQGSNGQSGSSGQGGNDGQSGFSGTGASSFSGQFGQDATQNEAGQSPDDISGQSGNDRQDVPQQFSSGASARPKGPQRRPGQNGNGASNGLSMQFGSAKPSSNGFNSFSQSSQSSSFGSNNEYLPPVNNFNQNGRPGARPISRPQGSAEASSEESSSSSEESNESTESLGNAIPLSQQAVEKRPQESSFTSFGQPSSNGLTSKPEAISQSGRPGQPGNLGKPGQPGQTGQSGQFGRPGQPGRPGQLGQPSRPGFGFTADVAAQSSNNEPASNIFAQGVQSSQASSSLGNNEYLPPSSGFNQNRRPAQNRPQGSNSAPQFNQKYNGITQASGNMQSRPGQSGFQSRPSQFNGFQRPQSSSNGISSFQNGNSPFPPSSNTQTQFASSSTGAQNGAPAQTTAFASFNTQQPTLQPATELVTPLEPDSTEDSQSSSQTTSSNFNAASSNGRPGQSQFGFNLNSQNSSPVPTSSSAFPSLSSQPAPAGRPQRPSSFGGRPTQSSAFPTQPSQGPVEQTSQFGDKQTESTQNLAPNDVQFSSSTQRPTFTQQAQGPDDSYYYNQPSKPFDQSQASRFPNAPSNQFDRMTQQAMFSQNNGQFLNTQNIQNTPFSQNGQSQGSNKYPRPPTVAPSIIRTQNGQLGGSSKNPRPPTLAPVTGITQASISPFPSEAPTQSTQFGSQSKFGSKPSFQQPGQYNQAQVTQSGKPAFGQQPTATPQSFPQMDQNQGQQSFGQPQNQPESSDDVSQDVTNQQYNGEIYEYNKPAQPLPVPSDEESLSGSGQFGQKVQGQFVQTKPQFGQSESSEVNQSDITPTLGFQKTEESQGPQFGAQPSRIQSGQNTQGYRPQFGAQSRPQFSQTQTGNRFGAQISQDEETRPQSFGSQPDSQLENKSESQEAQQQAKPQFGNTIRPSCCQSSRFGMPQPTQAKPTQGFGAQNSFSAAQSSRPEAGTSSFAGKGEVFGSPDRKPPSFDEQTGYHY